MFWTNGNLYGFALREGEGWVKKSEYSVNVWMIPKHIYHQKSLHIQEISPTKLNLFEQTTQKIHFWNYQRKEEKFTGVQEENSSDS